LQSIKYDLINPSKVEKSASQYSDLYHSGKIMLSKMNNISAYMEKANPTQPHINENYNRALAKDANIFRKRGDKFD
jgi:hypothetical protein